MWVKVLRGEFSEAGGARLLTSRHPKIFLGAPARQEPRPTRCCHTVFSFVTFALFCGKFFRMAELDPQLDKFLRRQPKLGKGVYLARTAVVIGDVTLGAHSSVWYGAVLRGDINRIVVGHHSNVQDNAVLHLADKLPCVLGNWVTVGHGAIVHACSVGDECLVGMGAVILDGAVIGKQSIIGAKALVTQGTKIPPGSLVLGAPAKVVRKLTKEERAGLKWWAQKYVDNGAYCLKHGIGVGAPVKS
jgi:carbonic anhydrase/acetyltransferase-like protein (isoleucine patch superfamily)